MALTKITYSMIQGAAINVLDYGADNTGATNCTSQMQAAITACPVGGVVFFPAGVYLGYLFVYRSDITLMGAGSAATTIKLPNACPTITVPHDGVPNPITGLPNVIEIGECALGNAANTYQRVSVIGMTLDGNYANNTAPTTDLFGHGLIATKISNLVIDDVVAKNCFLTGIDVVINSNYARVNARVENCGNATVYGGHYPNFDINSSKYGEFDVTSVGGYYGARMLDNCWNNTFTARIYNPSFTGFVYNNQSVNASYANIINVSVVDGCGSGQGVSIGSNCSNSQINATVRNVAGVGVLTGGASASTGTTSNIFNINTFNCGSAGLNVAAHSYYNIFNVCSKQDGRAGSPGNSFAVDVDGGDSNQFTVNIQEGATPQVRGFVFRSGATGNTLIDLIFDSNLVEAINDLGTNNYIHRATYYPTSSIASSNIVNLPFYGSMFSITGTTGIAGIANNNTNRGRQVTLTFDGNVSLAQKSAAPGSNLMLAGSTAFNATANDTITFISNGTDWIEISRTVI